MFREFVSDSARRRGASSFLTCTCGAVPSIVVILQYPQSVRNPISLSVRRLKAKLDSLPSLARIIVVLESSRSWRCPVWRRRRQEFGQGEARPRVGASDRKTRVRPSFLYVSSLLM